MTDGPKTMGGGGSLAARTELSRVAASLDDLGAALLADTSSGGGGGGGGHVSFAGIDTGLSYQSHSKAGRTPPVRGSRGSSSPTGTTGGGSRRGGRPLTRLFARVLRLLLKRGCEIRCIHGKKTLVMRR